jgi:hypothetical protein
VKKGGLPALSLVLCLRDLALCREAQGDEGVEVRDLFRDLGGVLAGVRRKRAGKVGAGGQGVQEGLRGGHVFIISIPRPVTSSDLDKSTVKKMTWTTLGP